MSEPPGKPNKCKQRMQKQPNTYQWYKARKGNEKWYDSQYWKKTNKKKLENLDESRWIAYHGEVEIIDIKL